jgi:glycosyltransferase involved in cell wall biosynthesis
MPTVAHLSSAHPRHDTRILIKECQHLAQHGYDVTLVVADGLGPQRHGDVAITDVGRSHSRTGRMLGATRRVLQRAIALDADLYHLHDPELIPAGLRLKRLGKTVIFDAHEDVPLQLLSKPYLGPLARRLTAQAFGAYERYACGRFDGIVAATPAICAKFSAINRMTVAVSNYPLLSEFPLTPNADWSARRRQVCYVGSIARVRGVSELVAACALLASDARISLAGRFDDAGLETTMRAQPGWQRVDALGHLDRAGVASTMAASMAGLVTLQAAPNYLDALPVKMFEYMAAGIPVIASDIALWRDIVDTSGCGMCVDQRSPAAIAAAIDYMVTHPEHARDMGHNGRQAVISRYNWDTQGARLLAFYDQLRSDAPTSRTHERNQHRQHSAAEYDRHQSAVPHTGQNR